MENAARDLSDPGQTQCAICLWLDSDGTTALNKQLPIKIFVAIMMLAMMMTQSGSLKEEKLGLLHFAKTLCIGSNQRAGSQSEFTLSSPKG